MTPTSGPKIMDGVEHLCTVHETRLTNNLSGQNLHTSGKINDHLSVILYAQWLTGMHALSTMVMDKV